jgi:hypothetical protein
MAIWLTDGCGEGWNLWNDATLVISLRMERLITHILYSEDGC